MVPDLDKDFDKQVLISSQSIIFSLTVHDTSLQYLGDSVHDNLRISTSPAAKTPHGQNFKITWALPSKYGYEKFPLWLYKWIIWYWLYILCILAYLFDRMCISKKNIIDIVFHISSFFWYFTGFLLHYVCIYIYILYIHMYNSVCVYLWIMSFVSFVFSKLQILLSCTATEPRSTFGHRIWSRTTRKVANTTVLIHRETANPIRLL